MKQKQMFSKVGWMFMSCLVAFSPLSANTANDTWHPTHALKEKKGETSILVKRESAKTENLKLRYSTPDLKVFSLEAPLSGEATKRLILGNAPLTSEEGEPKLPTIPFQFIIPEGETLEKIEIIRGGKVVVPGSHVIEHGETAVPLSTSWNSVRKATPKAEIYNSDAAFPAASHQVISIQEKRGVRVGFVQINPVQYQPKSGVITYYTDISVEVITTKEAPLNSGRKLRVAHVDAATMNVENPEDLSSYTTSAPLTQIQPLGPLVDPSESFQYVIVTSEEIRDANTDVTIRDLVAHKEANGTSATIVAIEDVLSGYPGVDDAEKLRNFIIDAYNGWETEYVLLGGDINIIPMRQIHLSYSIYTKDIPSDVYFQCLNGDWNNDGDAIWGEKNDGVDGGDIDLMAEVLVGRASAENPEEMSNFVYKTLAHANLDLDAPFRKQALMVGEDMGNWTGRAEFANYYMDEIKDGSSNHGYVTAGFAANPDFTVETLYDFDAVWSVSQLTSQINSNSHAIYNHLGHGLRNWALKMGSSTALGLTNTQHAFIYTQACYSGEFDADCLAEKLTTSTRNGMHAVIMNSRYGWGSTSSTDGDSQQLNREFWDAYFNEGLSTLGALNADSHEDNIVYANRTLIRWCIFETTLFGDPQATFIEATVPVTDVALNKRATSSSYEDATVTAQKAIDGNSTTRWSSLWTNDQWIAVDLQGTFDISKVVLNWETACAKTYEVQSSVDGITWKTEKLINNGTPGVIEIALSITNVNHMRIKGIERATQWGYSLYDFEVYGAPGELADPELTSIEVNNMTYNINEGKNLDYTAYDQYGNVMSTTISSVECTGGQYVRQGFFRAGSTPGSFPLTINAGSVSGTATLTVVDPNAVESLIKNGEFTNGPLYWSLSNAMGAIANSSAAGGQLHLAISNGGSDAWNVQYKQNDIAIEAGKEYILSFSARAQSSRSVDVIVEKDGSPWTSYSSQLTYSISSSWDTYTETFTAGYTDAAARFVINAGGNSSDLYFDNITLTEKSQEPPTLTSIVVDRKTVSVGESFSLTFTTLDQFGNDFPMSTTPSFAISGSSCSQIGQFIFRANSAGTCTATVSYGVVSGSASVTVIEEQEVTRIDVDNITLNLNETKEITYRVYDQNDILMTVTPEIDQHIYMLGQGVLVNKPNVTGTSEGTGQISVTYQPSQQVRIAGTASVTVTEQRDPVLISQNKPVNASSVEGTHLKSYVNDGSTTTRWSSDFSDPQWIEIDLQGTFTVTSVSLNWETAAASNYTIEVTADGSSWYAIETVTNGNGGVDQFTFNEENVAKIRMHGTQRTTVWGYSLFEFKVYGIEGVREPAYLAELKVDPVTTTVGDMFTVNCSGLDQYGDAFSISGIPNYSVSTPSAAQQIDMNIFVANTAGSYTYTCATGGLTKSAALTINPEGGDNMITNGDFMQQLTGWDLENFESASASTSVVNGNAKITMSNAGTASWNVQFKQGGLELINGRSYTLSFDAWSQYPRDIEVKLEKDGSPWTAYSGSRSNYSISGGSATSTHTFTMTDATDMNARIVFNVGGNSIDVNIDNVQLVEN
ncbi:MAG: C25 family cysteine peptidase [Fibrobacterales bacterium]